MNACDNCVSVCLSLRHGHFELDNFRTLEDSGWQRALLFLEQIFHFF